MKWFAEWWNSIELYWQSSESHCFGKAKFGLRVDKSGIGNAT